MALFPFKRWKDQKNVQTNYEDRVGLLSQLTFQWIFPLLSIGYLRPLRKEDIEILNPGRTVAEHQDTVSELFHRGLAGHRRFPLLWALHDAFKAQYWLGGLAMLFANMLQIMAPLLLRYLLISLSNGSSVTTSLIYVAMLFSTQMGMSFALVHYHYLGQVVGSHIKAILTAMIFEKSLKLSSNKSHNWTEGKISNLITVDSQRIESALLYANMIWSEPLAVVMALVILFYNLDWSALSGLILLLAGAKGVELSMGWLMSGRMAINAEVDDRASLLQEALQNMKFVKFHAWEPYFLRRILGARATEVQQQRRLLNLRSTLLSLSMSLPSYAAMISFIMFMVFEGRLSAAEAFSSLALFNCLRKPLNILPMVLSQLIDAWVSLQRIESFLMAKEQRDAITWNLKADNAVEIANASFIWNHVTELEPISDDSSAAVDEETALLSVNGQFPPHGSQSMSPTLYKINLQIRPGELVAISGPVGAGKSALLFALAGQMNQIEGRVTLGTTRSFCSQVPWIESGTVRDNILFGKPLRQPWYDQVVEACALTPDLNTWEEGDATCIGEQGITLSGGQKQRIILARTIYADADLLLLDDPLSAVDADAGRHIFNEAIRGLLRGKTCLLVSHQRHIIAQCGRVVWLEHGHIKSDSKISNEPSGNALSSMIPTQEGSRVLSSTDPLDGRLKDEAESLQRIHENKPMISSEPQHLGSVKGSIYKTYFSASGSIFHWPLLFLLLTVSQIAGISTSIWLSWWVDDTFAWDHSNYITGYVILGVIQSVLMWAYLSQASIVGLRASDNLFQTALERVLYAPLSFHTANPVGRLVNLFSSDVSQLDNGISDTIRAFFLMAGISFSIVLLISVQFPLFVISFPGVLFAVCYTSRYYRASRQELKRFETVSRSTVAAKATECIAGRQTIRSFESEDVFKARLNVVIDEASNFSRLTSASQQWLNLRLDTLGNVLLFFVGALIVFYADSIPASMSGLIMTYALAVVQIIPGVVSQTAEIESSLITVERMIYYGTEIPKEISTPVVVPPSNWPETGAITMQNVSLRYRSDLPRALHEVNLRISGGEKIGVIGRTGAGKSSIISALFQLFPLEDGSIVIDNINIAKVDRQFLRSKLAIIPQDPTIFEGTVRSNLDPAGEFPDDVLYNTLRKASPHTQVHLDHQVIVHGANFSLGERQLLALARALVRDPRILICDEATSAVDQGTDRAVQQTLLTAFRDRTVICIAHRLHTIIRYDRICMVDQGRVVGFQSPLVLFDTNAEFRQICELNRITREDIV